jgi:hypothetical protein
MQNPQPAKRRLPTPEEVIAQQKIDAARSKQQQTDAARAAQQQKAAPAKVPAVKPAATPPVAVPPDNRTPLEKYLDEIAPASFPGQLIKFSKEGTFVRTSDGEAVDTDHDLVALCDETLVGWIKFSGEEGMPPERVQGLLYSGFVKPDRATLGDNDATQWPIGVSGAPTDPWLHQMALVLEDRATHDLLTFATTSDTGRRAVGNLLKHFERLKRTHPDHYPVVRLKSGGFHSKKPGVGWVHTPVFAVIGRAPKAAAVVPLTRLSLQKL